MATISRIESCPWKDSGTPSRCPGSSTLMVGGHAQFLNASVPPARPPAPASKPGFRLNDTVTAGSCPKWLMLSGPTPRDDVHHRVERHQRTLRGADIELRQRLGRALVLRVHLDDDRRTGWRAYRWSRPAGRHRRCKARPAICCGVTPSARARSRSISTITCGLAICRSVLTSTKAGQRAHLVHQPDRPRRRSPSDWRSAGSAGTRWC